MRILLFPVLTVAAVPVFFLSCFLPDDIGDKVFEAYGDALDWSTYGRLSEFMKED